MEYSVISASHPSVLTLNLPVDVADLLQFDPGSVRGLRSPGRSVTFLARGPGVVRVVGSYAARDLVALETAQNRNIGPALVSVGGVFNLPIQVARHLGLQLTTTVDRAAKTTLDGLLWFVPSPEYFEYRAHQRSGRRWTGPAPGGFAHVYLARDVLPFSRGFEPLTDLEGRIDAEEWRPRWEALQRAGRTHR